MNGGRLSSSTLVLVYIWKTTLWKVTKKVCDDPAIYIRNRSDIKEFPSAKYGTISHKLISQTNFSAPYEDSKL